MVVKSKSNDMGANREQSNCDIWTVKVLNGAAFLFLFAIFAFAGQLGVFSFTNLDRLSSNPRRDQVCGRFAFYSFLQFTGREFTYDEVSDVVPMAERGTSLLELRDAARKLGVEFEIRKTLSTDQTVMQQGPFIAHLRKSRVTEDKYSAQEFDGHYVLVLPPRVWRTPNEIDAIDGTSGMIETYSFMGFPKLWTGYYLIEKPSFTSDIFVDMGLAGIAALLAGYWFFQRWFQQKLVPYA